MEHPPPLEAAAFARLTGTTDEQLERLAAVVALLERWHTRIALVGGSTMRDPWRRHILDSAQLLPLLPAGQPVIADLGSGAGFPGLVLAILGGGEVMLVESDRRKCAFLTEAARVSGTRVDIRPVRIEAPPPRHADVVCARALAPLPKLLDLAANWLAPQGVCLFLKGRNAGAELTEADKQWKMHYSEVASRSDPAGVILRIEKVSRRES